MLVSWNHPHSLDQCLTVGFERKVPEPSAVDPSSDPGCGRRENPPWGAGSFVNMAPAATAVVVATTNGENWSRTT